MNDLSSIAKQLGSKGGKKFVETHLKGKTKEERSEFMRRVRLSSKKAK